jgi:hypothetical protein
MLIASYVFAIRSEPGLSLVLQARHEDAIPDHLAFSRARNERFREGEVFRRVFERVVDVCIAAGVSADHRRTMELKFWLLRLGHFSSSKLWLLNFDS